MLRILIMAYAIASYVAFLAVFVWLMAFLLDFGSIRTANTGSPLPQAAAINILLISLFGLVHSVMARSAFKRQWTKIIPKSAERATYVLQSSVLLAVIMLFWQSIPDVVWRADGIAQVVLLSVFFSGVVLIVVSTFALDHFEFTGLRQAWCNLNDTSASTSRFRTPLPYRIVRHPLQLGILLVVFSVPEMTVGGLLFAVVMLAYILIGLQFEERALLREFGDDYAAYRHRVPMLVPRLRNGSKHRARLRD
ncbi:isoprenylcysteine carboxylmethyltransferase family protein [Loktanella sp. Alg231-35]|uniref:isoprenylcysteine carboxylmethyltransferase family protein n=1 Tax=Loktanella sp. Alg231-35 TaxID=1922220 RepID=UPI0018FF7CD8|nr:isoprenylcysteine carboxylmethyltransferase family protein [Loktanella sp. Alg231-35]